MSTTLCQQLQESWELLLDGALPRGEHRRLQDHLATCEACQDFVHQDFRLSEALRTSLPRPTLSFDRSGNPWLRRGAVAAAALILVSLGWMMGAARSDAKADGGRAVPEALLAEAGPLEAGGDEIERRLPGGGEFVLAPTARVDVALADDADPILRLERGSLVVQREAGEAVIETLSGWVEVEGTVTVQMLAQEQAAPVALVTVLSGRAGVTSIEGETAEARPGAPFLLGGERDGSLASHLERERRLSSDEALVVMTSEEAMEIAARQNAERTELERRVGELMETNQQLQLRLDAYSQRRGGKRVAPVSVDEMVRILAARTDALAKRTPGEKTPGRGERKHESMRHLFWAMRRIRKNPDEALPAIRKHLLAAEASLARKLLGLKLLSRFRRPEVAEMVIPFVTDEERLLRKSALSCLARQRDASLRPLLENAFRDDASLSNRITAAGGLVALGDTGAPLDRLVAWYRDPETSRRHRRYALTRILRAPVARISDFLVEVAGNDDALEERDLRGVVELLGQLGTPEAARVLEQLATRVDEPRLVLFIRATLEAMGPR